MRRVGLVVTLGLAASVWGCGGGSDNSSPFAGSYRGTFVANAQQQLQNGYIRIVVAPDGHFTGTIDNATAGASGTTSGSIATDGQMTSSYQYPGNLTYTANGGVAKNNQGDIVGTLQEFQNGTNVGTVSVDLIFVPAFAPQ